MAFVKITSLILDAARSMRRGGRLVVWNGKAKHDRLISIPGPGLDIVHRRTFESLKRHGLIVRERRDSDATRYALTDLGRLLVDDIVAFRRLNRECHSVRGAKRPQHDVDPATRYCRRCGRGLAELLCELDKGGQVKPCVTNDPPSVAIEPGSRLALPEAERPTRTAGDDDIIDGEYEDAPDAGP